MLLHIGNGETVRKKDIIGIFDMDTATLSPVTKKTLHRYETANRLHYGDSDIPRSFLLLSEAGNKEESEICLSLISPRGLTQRSENIFTSYDENN